MGQSIGLSGSDFYAQYRSVLIFPKACTASNFAVNLGFENLSSPFDLETDLLVNGAIGLSCNTGFDSATGVGFSCKSSSTYSIPAGAQVVLRFTHSGTNPSNVFPQATFACN